MNPPNTSRRVIVLGASRSPHKYGNKAVRAYLERGDEVYPVNPHGGMISGQAVYRDLDELPIETTDLVSIYLPPEVGLMLVDLIADFRPAEIWLNPGSESPELIASLKERGLNVVQACSILSVGRFPSEFD